MEAMHVAWLWACTLWAAHAGRQGMPFPGQPAKRRVCQAVTPNVGRWQLPVCLCVHRPQHPVGRRSLQPWPAYATGRQ